MKHSELDAMEWQKNLGQHSTGNGQQSRKQQTAHADVSPRSSHKQASALAACGRRQLGLGANNIEREKSRTTSSYRPRR